ncbi:unnamed protein product [Rhizophagus irregularis]|nr:unnamed protein product [Rhizophagus irregularis]CAB5332338.1 unnamed protein product [Rhizophagus irregularis]
MEAGYKRTLRHARAVVYSGRRCLYLIRCFDLHAYHLNLFLCTDAYMFAEQIRVQIDFNELLEVSEWLICGVRSISSNLEEKNIGVDYIIIKRLRGS